jgi:hypothetical protein
MLDLARHWRTQPPAAEVLQMVHLRKRPRVPGGADLPDFSDIPDNPYRAGDLTDEQKRARALAQIAQLKTMMGDGIVRH